MIENLDTMDNHVWMVLYVYDGLCMIDDHVWMAIHLKMIQDKTKLRIDN